MWKTGQLVIDGEYDNHSVQQKSDRYPATAPVSIQMTLYLGLNNVLDISEIEYDLPITYFFFDYSLNYLLHSIF